MRRNLAQSLIQHGQITTTLPKAKEVRPFVERLITLARRDTVAARQRVEALLCDRAVIPADRQEEYDGMSDARRQRVLRARSGRRHRTGEARPGVPFTAESVIRRLFTDIAPRYADRPGGYTRIIKLARTRIGDGGELAILQLVGEEEAPKQAARARGTNARRARAKARRDFVKRLANAPRPQEAEPPAAEQAAADADTEADAPEADGSAEET